MNEKKPFDDGNKYLQKHIGVPKEGKMNKLPKPLRMIGYSVIGFMVLFLILMLVSYVLYFLN